MNLSYPIAVPDAGIKVMAWCMEYENAFTELKNMGYPGIELVVRDPQTVDTGCLDAMLMEHGLELSAIGTSPMQLKDGLFIMHPDSRVRTEAEDRLKGLIELAARYQTSLIIGKYRGMTAADDFCSLSYLKERMAAACQFALSYGVDLYLEPQSESNINNINTISQAMDFISQVGCDNLKILADVYHMAFTEPDLCQAIDVMGSRLGMIHMSDSGRRIPGQGDLPVREVLSALKQAEFQGYVSMEIKQEPDSRTAAQRSIEFLEDSNGRKKI